MSKVSENGVVRDMTAEEQAAFDAITTQATADNNANKYKLENVVICHTTVSCENWKYKRNLYK